MLLSKRVYRLRQVVLYNNREKKASPFLKKLKRFYNEI